MRQEFVLEHLAISPMTAKQLAYLYMGHHPGESYEKTYSAINHKLGILKRQGFVKVEGPWGSKVWSLI